jgi:hypothetical protein
MPCRSGSPQDVFNAGAWADVPVMDAAMTAPTAVAAIATVIVEPEKRSSMINSFRLAWRYVSRFCSKAHYLSRRSIREARVVAAPLGHGRAAARRRRA